MEKQATSVLRRILRSGADLAGASSRDIKWLKRRGIGGGFSSSQAADLRSRGMIPSVERYVTGFDTGTNNIIEKARKTLKDEFGAELKVERRHSPTLDYHVSPFAPSGVQGGKADPVEIFIPPALVQEGKFTGKRNFEDVIQDLLISRHEASELSNSIKQNMRQKRRGLPITIATHPGARILQNPVAGTSHLPGVIQDERRFTSALYNNTGIPLKWEQLNFRSGDGSNMFIGRPLRDIYNGRNPQQEAKALAELKNSAGLTDKELMAQPNIRNIENFTPKARIVPSSYAKKLQDSTPDPYSLMMESLDQHVNKMLDPKTIQKELAKRPELLKNPQALEELKRWGLLESEKSNRSLQSILADGRRLSSMSGIQSALENSGDAQKHLSLMNIGKMARGRTGLAKDVATVVRGGVVHARLLSQIKYLQRMANLYPRYATQINARISDLNKRVQTIKDYMPKHSRNLARIDVGGTTVAERQELQGLMDDLASMANKKPATRNMGQTAQTISPTVLNQDERIRREIRDGVDGIFENPRANEYLRQLAHREMKGLRTADSMVSSLQRKMTRVPLGKSERLQYPTIDQTRRERKAITRMLSDPVTPPPVKKYLRTLLLAGDSGRLQQRILATEALERRFGEKAIEFTDRSLARSNLSLMQYKYKKALADMIRRQNEIQRINGIVPEKQYAMLDDYIRRNMKKYMPGQKQS